MPADFASVVESNVDLLAHVIGFLSYKDTLVLLRINKHMAKVDAPEDVDKLIWSPFIARAEQKAAENKQSLGFMKPIWNVKPCKTSMKSSPTDEALQWIARQKMNHTTRFRDQTYVMRANEWFSLLCERCESRVVGMMLSALRSNLNDIEVRLCKQDQHSQDLLKRIDECKQKAQDASERVDRLLTKSSSTN